MYKYVTAKVAKIVLATRKLRWSSPLLFNDPFDCTQELRLNFDESQLNAALTERVASLMEDGDPTDSVKHPIQAALLRVARRASPEVRRAMADELRQDEHATTPGQVQALAAVKDMWKNMVPTFRVLCLSELNDVTSMWLHYADAYKGVVLEFSAIDELDSPLLAARPVIYQDEPPAIADAQAWVSCMLGQGPLTYWDLFTEYEYVKTNAWSYEKEWRVVWHGKKKIDYEDTRFNPEELSCIYLGCRIEHKEAQDLIGLAKTLNPKVQVFKGRKSAHAFSVDFDIQH